MNLPVAFIVKIQKRKDENKKASLNLFLSFDQNRGSYSYKIVLVKEAVYTTNQ